MRKFAAMRPDIQIRNASAEDISFVAGCVLAAYYATLGFKAEREIDAFGDRYTRMILDI